MTSVQQQDERTSGTMKKPKLANEKMSIDRNNTNYRDETRSFIDNFSRENLSISQCELEQGFNKPTTKWFFGISRENMLSVIAIVVALVCAGVEIFKLHRVVTNGHEIEILKRDVESLRHRMFGNDFMDELKAFEQQLYADGTEDDDDDDDSGEADIEGADYDNNYYEDYGGPSWMDDGPTVSPSINGETRHESYSPLVNGPELKTTSSNPSNRNRVVVVGHHKKIEATRGHQFDKNPIPTEQRFLDETRQEQGTKTQSNKENKTKDDHPKQRRAVTDNKAAVKYTAYFDDSRHTNRTRDEIIDHSDDKHPINNTDETTNPITETTDWDRRPPKKYFGLARSDNSHHALLPDSRHSSRRQISSFNQRQELPRSQQESKVSRKWVKRRGITRRHVRSPRQVSAAHYGADSSLFSMDDEHTGNGRAKHNQGIFKAWRPSDWVADLGMTRHFTLSRDGKLTVHDPGLYLVYGQIHYLDEHDENGFHILVNNHPILQCMVYSPGMGHKSRSCFSAQITVFQAGDRLVLKDVGPARYTLFQHDKSFFGLIKLGDSRQQLQSQRQHSTTPPPEPLS